MKILYWNVRGLANSPTRLALKNLLIAHKPDIVVISEPWMDFDLFPKGLFGSIEKEGMGGEGRDLLC
jgi:exonuclease III